MRSSPVAFARIVVCLVACLVVSAGAGGCALEALPALGLPCTTDQDCPSGYRCFAGELCAPPPGDGDAGPPDGGPDDGGMPDVQIVTYEFDKMAMSFDCTGFTEKYMFKTPMSIRESDQFPFWPLNTCRIEIYGTRRMMYVGRVGGGWQVLEEGPPELGAVFGNVVAQHYGRFPDEPHAANFIDSIRTRQTPNADVEQGHMAACLEHLANLSYRLGNAKLAFDGATETFVGNDEANQHLKPSYRQSYEIPEEV